MLLFIAIIAHRCEIKPISIRQYGSTLSFYHCWKHEMSFILKYCSCLFWFGIGRQPNLPQDTFLEQDNVDRHKPTVDYASFPSRRVINRGIMSNHMTHVWSNPKKIHFRNWSRGICNIYIKYISKILCVIKLIVVW